VYACAWRGHSELPIPLLHDLSQLGPQRHERVDTFVEIRQPLDHERPHALTGRATVIALAQHARQVVQRKADDQRALNQAHSRDGIRRVPAVAAGQRAGAANSPFFS
jgi:hypothetical protein